MKELYHKLDEFIVLTEICLLLIINVMLGNKCLQGLILIIEFMFIRTILGAMHYEDRNKCFCMTILLMTSIFLVLKINFILATVSVFLATINLSDRKTIKHSSRKFILEGFMYKPKANTKYKVIDEYIESNQNSKDLKEFEDRLKICSDERTYNIYKMRFHERDKNNECPSLENIEAKTGVKQRRIVEKLDSILLSFKVFCKVTDKSNKK